MNEGAFCHILDRSHRFSPSSTLNIPKNTIAGQIAQMKFGKELIKIVERLLVGLDVFSWQSKILATSTLLALHHPIKQRDETIKIVDLTGLLVLD